MDLQVEDPCRWNHHKSAFGCLWISIVWKGRFYRLKFAPIIMYNTLCAATTMAGHNDCKIYHLNVKMTFWMGNSTKKCLCWSQKYLKNQAKRTRSTVFAKHYPSWNRHMYIEVDKYLKSQGSKKGSLLGKGENCPFNSLHCLCVPHTKALWENSVDQKWGQGEAKNVEFVESFIGARIHLST
jgi:hypothetical protein